MKKVVIFSLLIVFGFSYLQSQSIDFEAYKEFLEKNKGITYDELIQQYPIGYYKGDLHQSISNIEYYDLINKSIGITDYENSLLEKHNFFVTERKQYNSFHNALYDLFRKDLPLFISTDAILHSIHRSYDAILQDIELAVLIPKLKTILLKLHNYTNTLLAKYTEDTILSQSIKDYDVYFTIARKLLEDSNIAPIIPSNSVEIDSLMKLIKNEMNIEYPLFSYNIKQLDFSQFTIRGHYTDNPELGKYFQSMIWLGRIELYLIEPEPAINLTIKLDVQRQIIDAMFVLEAAEKTNVLEDINAIDNIIKALIGESDNVKLNHLREISNEINVSGPEAFLDLAICDTFKVHLAEKSYADQKILSQMLWADPLNVEGVKPASAFLLFGQRFVIDSYITGNVVFDKVKSRRMLPSYLDVLFALGNNASLSFLESELNKYNYTPNLAGLRFLVDQNDNEFWNSTFYNNWLQSLRTLNPPTEKELPAYPLFMQTAAWWQQKMTTQLASWTQLRHDNLLYVKPSYTAMVPICSYPDVYLEPLPKFYEAVQTLAQSAQEKLETYLNNDDIYSNYSHLKYDILEYFRNLGSISNQLADIANKEFNNQPINEEENKFLHSILFKGESGGCGGSDSVLLGWYSSLFYRDDADSSDFIVADIHTSPTDEEGGMVGWVYHIGTGKLNTAMVVVERSDGTKRAYLGPVMSFYQNTSINFKRYTDEEWEANYFNDPSSMKPDFVNLYMAGKQGEMYSINQPSLPLGVEDVIVPISSDCISLSNYPNPFINSTLITMNLSCLTKPVSVSISIYDLSGNLVKDLFTGELYKGNYSIRWDGNDLKNIKASKGAYLYKAKIDNKIYTGKIMINE